MAVVEEEDEEEAGQMKNTSAKRLEYTQIPFQAYKYHPSHR
jgi:hypothetical protein